MNQQYVQCAARIIGELEIRYNWASAKNNPREAVINLWALELSKFNLQALNKAVIEKAMKQWDVDCDGKPPVVGQFMKILRSLTHDFDHRYLKALEDKVPEKKDWIKLFNDADNKGKFSFFMKNQNVTQASRWYAKTWFMEHTKFKDEQILDIVNGRIPQ